MLEVIETVTTAVMIGSILYLCYQATHHVLTPVGGFLRRQRYPLIALISSVGLHILLGVLFSYNLI